MRKGKRFQTLILVLTLMFGLLPQSFAAAEVADDGGDGVKGVAMPIGPTVVASSSAEYTFDISEGNITIGDADSGRVTVTYGAEQTTSEPFANTQQIIITGNTNSNVVTVEEGVTANITLENVDIDVSERDFYACAFSLNAGSSVSLTLSGINTLKSGGRAAGLAVPDTASLLITEGSTGELTASGGRGAGIGGGDNGVNGEITISGGFVNATGRNYSAGIGGGNFSSYESAVCGLITITGGVVTATGGEFAAGIGGGRYNSGRVVITGGTVAATGGRYGAGIGGGYGGNGTVVINDGNVTATGGTQAAGLGGSTGVGKVTINGGRIETDSDSGRGIGGGTVLQGCEIVITGGSVKSGSMGVAPTNGESPVYQATVELYGITAQTMTYSVDDEDEMTLDTPDGRLYLWLTEGAHTISVRSEIDEDYGSEFTVQANNDNRVSPTTDATSVTDGNIVITSAGGYVITGSTTVNSIAVSNGIEGDVYITLEDVSIDVSTVYSACAFSVGEGSSVILTLKGTNTLISGGGAAGLAVPGTASLRIAEDSTGELTAEGGIAGAGIGSGEHVHGGNITIRGGIITAMGGMAGAGIGGGQHSNGGNVTIHGGVVTATGGDGGAGIGGGQYGNGGNVTIQGGVVTAAGGYGGSGVGGGNDGNGGNVTIQGGVVTAAGGYGGSGIGGGINGSGGNVMIRGGTVKALAGGDSENIGKGRDGTDAGILKNLSSDEGGTDVFLTTVILAGVTTESVVRSLTINLDEESYSYGITGVFTDTTGRLYLYLPEGAEVTEVETRDVTYIGWIATTTDHLAAGTLSPDTATQLTVPENLAWDGMTPGKATWLGDENAIGYVVQLYKSGTALDDPINVLVAEHEFISAIEAAGTGVYTFAVKAIGDGVNYTDSTGSPVSAEYSYIAPSTGTAPTITTAILPGGTVGEAYNQTLEATGDTPISWTIDSGSLPDGLTLSDAGVISGTPTTTGTFDFTAQATNAEGSDIKALEIIISSVTVPSGDNHLSDLTVGGSTVGGFDPSDDEYHVELPYGTKPGSVAARVDATANDPLARVSIIQASALPGSATVTITAEDGTIKVYRIDFTIGTVPTVPVTSITVTGTGGASGVQVGNTLQMLADVLPTNATDKTVTWSIESGSGATINASGLLTATTEDAVIVRATANDGSGVYDEAVITLTEAVSITYSITASAGSGGAISPSGTVNVTEGNSQTFTITPNPGYRINSVTVDGTKQGTITTYTFNHVTTGHAIHATFSRKSGGGGGGDSSSSTPSTPTAPDYEAEVKEGNSTKMMLLPVTVDKDAETASIDLGSREITLDGTVVTIPPIPGANTYSVGIPVSDLSSTDSQGALTLNTNTGSITVPSNMLTGVSENSGSRAQISIGQRNRDNLPDDVKFAIGDRPIIQLTMILDGAQTEWSNPNAPVTVNMPYTPTDAELANPESIVIWYIDGAGNAVSVPNGRYDQATGTVTFFTTHFSDYAVAYVHKTFSDLGGVEWARKAIEVMASKGITSGTGDGTTFSPNVNITRADYMVLLIKTLGLTAEFTENFDDVQPGAYYYNAIGMAKKLGITAGSGNNRFNPTENISRQDMMVLTYRALEKYQGLKATDSSTLLDKFIDKGDIAEYAVNSLATLVDAGLILDSGDKLHPHSFVTRAEVAVFLYNIYIHYPEAPTGQLCREIGHRNSPAGKGREKSETVAYIKKPAMVVPDSTVMSKRASSSRQTLNLAGGIRFSTIPN